MRYDNLLQILSLPALVTIIFYGCANKVPPAGGPYDETPPKLIRATPANRSLNIKDRKITLLFDEYITLKGVQKKVIISPPQLQMPKMMAIGKEIRIELEDTLIPNTTYTIDFTDAIQDNNEGNALENFSFSFSTGNVIDTMEMSGVVLNARNLEPIPDVLVGIHPADSTRSLFRDTTFQRVSRASDRARFIIRNIPYGKYRLYALKESDGNYKYDNPNEGIAFLDSTVVTSSMPAVRNDTIRRDSLIVDTIKRVNYTRYLPDSLVLLFSQPVNGKRYVSKRKRPEEGLLQIVFNTYPDSLFQITPVDTFPLPQKDSLWHYLDGDQKSSSVFVYIKDSTMMKHERYLIQYPTLDSLNNPTLKRDTITLRRPKKQPPQNKKIKEEEKVPKDSIPQKPKSPFTVRVEHRGTGGISDSIFFITSLPIDTTALKGITLYNKKDSTLVPVPLESLSLLPNRSTVGLLIAPLKYSNAYEIQFDSLTFIDVFGHSLDNTFIDSFKTAAKDEFSQLEVAVHGVGGPIIAELLNTQDKIVYTTYSDTTTFVMSDLKPGKYGLRIILDRNKNRKWDPADFDKGVQPESVYYAPKIFELMKNWDMKENFYPLNIPLQEQKPKELIQTKPKSDRKKKRNRNEERAQQMRQKNNSYLSPGSLPFKF